MYNTVLKSIEIGDVDRNLNGVKYSIHYLRNSVRELDLSNRLSSSQISHEVTYQEIQASMQILNDTLSDLDTFISEYRLQDFYRQVFLSRSTLIWDQVSTNPTTYKLNFIDTLYTYLHHSQNILNSDPSTLTLLSPDLYFLFQNSFSDSIRSCNSTLEYLNNMEHDFMLNVRLYLIYGLLGIVAAILISGGLITKSLIEVQSSSDKVWSLILSLKSKVLRVLQMNVMYRLNFTHRVDSDKISSLHASDTSNIIRINAYKAWRAITLVLVMFCLINAVFYVCLYTVSLESIIQTIEIRPKMLSYCHNSLIGLLTTYFYAREKIYSDTKHSLFNITSDYILSPNPHQQFEKSLHLFKITSNQHLQMIQQEDLMTSYVYDLYYSSDSLANPYLGLGIAYAHSTFISDLIYLSSISHSQSSSDLIQEYHTIFQLLRSKHFSLSGEVMNSIEGRITDKMNSTVILIVMYSVMLIVVYFVVLLPVIRKIDQVVKSAWTFFNELHLGDIEEDGSNLTRNSN